MSAPPMYCTFTWSPGTVLNTPLSYHGLEPCPASTWSNAMRRFTSASDHLIFFLPTNGGWLHLHHARFTRPLHSKRRSHNAWMQRAHRTLSFLVGIVVDPRSENVSAGVLAGREELNESTVWWCSKVVGAERCSPSSGVTLAPWVRLGDRA